MLEKLDGLAVLVLRGVLYSDSAHDTFHESYVQKASHAHATQDHPARFPTLPRECEVIVEGSPP